MADRSGSLLRDLESVALSPRPTKTCRHQAIGSCFSRLRPNCAAFVEPNPAGENILVFINAGKNARSADKHAAIVTAHSTPPVRTGANEDNTKTRNASINIRFASTIGLPVLIIVSHMIQPSSSGKSLERSAVDCRYRLII